VTKILLRQNVGYPINGDFGADRYALMEVHFDNPSEVKPAHVQKAGLKLKEGFVCLRMVVNGFDESKAIIINYNIIILLYVEVYIVESTTM